MTVENDTKLNKIEIEATFTSDIKATNSQKKLKLSMPKLIESKAKSSISNYALLLSLTNLTILTELLVAKELTSSVPIKLYGTTMEIINERSSLSEEVKFLVDLKSSIDKYLLNAKEDIDN